MELDDEIINFDDVKERMKDFDFENNSFVENKEIKETNEDLSNDDMDNDDIDNEENQEIDYKAEFEKLRSKIDEQEKEKYKAPYTNEELYNLEKPTFESFDYDSEKYEKAMIEYYNKAQYKADITAQNQAMFEKNIRDAGYDKDEYMSVLLKTDEVSKELNKNIDITTLEKIKSFDTNTSVDIAYYLGNNLNVYKELLNLPVYQRVDKITEIAKIVEKDRSDKEKLSVRKKSFEDKKQTSDPISAQKNKLGSNKRFNGRVESVNDINSIEDYKEYMKNIK